MGGIVWCCVLMLAALASCVGAGGVRLQQWTGKLQEDLCVRQQKRIRTRFLFAPEDLAKVLVPLTFSCFVFLCLSCLNLLTSHLRDKKSLFPFIHFYSLRLHLSSLHLHPQSFWLKKGAIKIKLVWNYAGLGCLSLSALVMLRSWVWGGSFDAVMPLLQWHSATPDANAGASDDSGNHSIMKIT